MTDEKYLFTQDVRQKKNVARSARNRRTHTGKGGAVKFPSDFMTRKELNAMNGELKSYRLNEPMPWKEFKKMPDDVKTVYIKTLRQKYGVSDSKISKMLGATQPTVSAEIRRLGLGRGRNSIMDRPFDKEGWLAWLNGVPSPAPEAAEEAEEVQVVLDEVKCEPIQEHAEKTIPQCGSMTFDGNAEAALNTVGVLLGGANVRICITWELCDNG